MGYMALVLNTAVFNIIPNARAFIRLVYPGAFTVTIHIVTRVNPTMPVTGTDIAQQKAYHDESIRVYNKYQDIEQTLRSQIIEAIQANMWMRQNYELRI